MAIELITRNATLQDIAGVLQDQQAAKVDFVAPLSTLESNNAIITAKGTSVFGEGQQFRPTDIADAQIAGKLNIPASYLKTLRKERPDLYDANVNGFTKGGTLSRLDDSGVMEHVTFTPDDRQVLLRTFQTGDVEEPGILRALLSDRYGIIDNLDVLMAALEGIRTSGAKVDVVGADLTETRMTVRVVCPELMVHAPALLEGYRNPFGGGEGGGVYDHSGGKREFVRTVPEWAQKKFGVNEDGVFGGFVISNSETGGGAFSVIPRLMVLMCLNGAMLNRFALRQVHLGGRLQEGIVKWSDDTQQKSLELVASQARDAVETFLTPEFVQSGVDALTAKATKALDNPAEAIEFVGKKLAYTQEQQAGILDFFIKGGQVTTGGVFNAITAFAQTVANPDTAFDLEASAFEAMELAGRR